MSISKIVARQRKPEMIAPLWQTFAGKMYLAAEQVLPSRSGVAPNEPKACDTVILAGDLTRFVWDIEAQHQSVIQITSLPQAQAAVWLRSVAKSRQVSHLIVNVDDLGGIEEVFDSLRLIRDSIPTLPIILVSAKFSRDDFDTDRLAICDVCIRPGCSSSTLKAALTEAKNTNNPIWVERRRTFGAQ